MSKGVDKAMYSVPELARIYKTSKQTMYSKVKTEEMKPYIVDGQEGIKIDPSGLNTLNLIMANSKVAKSQVNGQDDSEHIHNHTDQLDQHLTDYINHLKGQIEDLKRDKQELQHEKQEIQAKHDQLINLLINKQKQLEEPKGFFSVV
jgi:chromosome segregation ATPase